MPDNELKVFALWDKEVGVWHAWSADVPGLVAEGESFEDLVSEVIELAPTLVGSDESGQIRVIATDFS